MENKIYKGAFFLGASNVLVKILGLIIIIPFSRMVGPIGTSLYSYAYVPYVFFMDVSTIGLVPGVSKLTSKFQASNEEDKTRYLIYKSKKIMLLIGLISFTLLNLLAPFLAKLVLGGNKELNNSTKDVIFAIRCISPSLILGPIVSLYRGFLQGNRNMYPTAISLIIEQIIRFVIILSGTYIYIKVLKSNYKYPVFLAVFSSAVALFLAYLFLGIFSKKYTKGNKEEFSYLKILYKTCIPIGITTIFLTIYQLIDSVTFNKYLLVYGATNVETMYALYSFESMRLIIIPVLLAQSLATSLMPNITKMHTEQQFDLRNKEINKIIELVISFVISVLIIFIYFSKEIYILFYNNDINGPKILASTCYLIYVFGINKVLIAILQGISKAKYLIITTICSFLLKYILNILLISKLGYIGGVLSSFISVFIILLVGFYLLKKENIITIKKILLINFKYIIIGILSLMFLISIRITFNVNMENFKTHLIGLSLYGLLYFLFFYIMNKILKK